MQVNATVLIDNKDAEGLCSEWGLSFYVEYGGQRYLLDAGGSDKFLDNAAKMGIDLSDIDLAVLSHAHYDHSLGMEAFFRANARAPFHISPNAAENCFGKAFIFHKYIGLPKGVMAKYPDRIVRRDGVYQPADGVWIVPHSAPVDSEVARKAHLFVRRGCRLVPDDFSHERSLVFETDRGLVIFNSCSHSGPEAIIEEVRSAVPGRAIAAYIGGLHLFRMSPDEVRALAVRFAGLGCFEIHTGHCTGDEAFNILKDVLGERVCQFHSGYKITI